MELAGLVNNVVGRATDPDGTVTVEVGVGGGLRSVKISPRAMRYGAKYLADTIVATAAKARARANERAHQLYQQALGSRGERLADQLGLTYDPALTVDEHRSASTSDADEDYPESWLR